MRFLCLVTLVSVLLMNRGSAAEKTSLATLAQDLTGHFSSLDQSRGDQNFRDVTLRVVPIWATRNDGPWLYAEQALTDASDHPYRQQVYQLALRTDASIEIRVFELADPVPLTGAWQDAGKFDQLSPKGLTANSGCALVLRAQADGSYIGSTDGHGCASPLRGASYSVSDFVITAKETVIWDRGYNTHGVQVWGSNHGGYVFKRVE